jgi:hypothetical protein
MEIEHVHERDIRYTLSNDNLQVGDKVYPIAMGRCRDDGSWVLHEFNWEGYMCGFPNEPHTIIEFKPNMYDSDKYRDVRTDYGSSPEYCYYKVIKKERQEKENDRVFSRWVWKPID